MLERLKENDLLNTSCPLHAKDRDVFRVYAFDDGHELAFYIHIPFCKQLCFFLRILPDIFTFTRDSQKNTHISCQ